MRAGDVFRFNGIADIHVWMIISDPDRNAQQTLIVNFTTWEPFIDQACIVEPGEHPFIAHRSLINFARARMVSDHTLEQLLASGRLQLLNQPLSPTLLEKIRRSAMNSTALSLEAADLLIAQELVE